MHTHPALRLPRGRLLAAAALALLCAQAGAGTGSPLIVQADVLPVQNEGGGPACALFVSASDVSGEFVAAALRWSRPQAEGLELELRLSPGQVDWRTGIESHGYAEEAWVSTATVDLSEALEPVERGEGDVYIARTRDAALAAKVFEEALSAPLRLLYTTEPGGPPRVFALEQPLEEDVRMRARACFDTLAPAP